MARNDDDSIVYILAGGKGTRLMPLTAERAKPAVPFGGTYRIIDFPLSSVFKSYYHDAVVVTQYRSASLEDHLQQEWIPMFGRVRSSLRIKSVEQGDEASGKGWFLGTAHPIMQDQYRLRQLQPQNVIVLGGDHIYKMNVKAVEDFHDDNGADITVVAKSVPVELAAKAFGVVVVDKDGRITGFEEKPEHPTPLPGNPGYCLASMGNYVFKWKSMDVVLNQDLGKQFVPDKKAITDSNLQTTHDFGNDIIPQMLRDGKWKMMAYDFNTNVWKGQEEHERGAWWDVGTIPQYVEANMELLKAVPRLNLYNRDWEIYTAQKSNAGAKLIFNDSTDSSIIPNGCIVSRSEVVKSILSWNTIVRDRCVIEESLLLGNTEVCPGVRIRGAIIDKENFIPNTVPAGLVERAREYYKDKPGTVPEGLVLPAEAVGMPMRIGHGDPIDAVFRINAQSEVPVVPREFFPKAMYRC